MIFKKRNRKKRSNKIVFWSVEEQEYLNSKSINEAIEEYLETLMDVKAKILKSDLPKNVTVTGYARRYIDENVEIKAENILVDLLENLDGEYGGEDNVTGIKDNWQAMMEETLKVIFDEYEPWQCVPVKEEKIDIMEWIKSHGTWAKCLK